MFNIRMALECNGQVFPLHFSRLEDGVAYFHLEDVSAQIQRESQTQWACGSRRRPAGGHPHPSLLGRKTARRWHRRTQTARARRRMGNRGGLRAPAVSHRPSHSGRGTPSPTEGESEGNAASAALEGAGQGEEARGRCWDGCARGRVGTQGSAVSPPAWHAGHTVGEACAGHQHVGSGCSGYPCPQALECCILLQCLTEIATTCHPFPASSPWWPMGSPVLPGVRGGYALT